jgi:ABC-type Mn2+/Zn2+ transport system ATPase subunit
MSETLIRAGGVAMGYGARPVLAVVDCEVNRGDVLGILGPNGAGKTTLLKTLLGLLAPVRGQVDYPSGPLRYGYVPQRQVVDETYPLTVGELVLMGRYGMVAPGRRPASADRWHVHRTLAVVGLADLYARRYRELSGGQKQRALLARALVGDPQVLVLDEPTTDMDLRSERAILELIARLRADHGLTVLLVSHLLHVVLSLATRVAFVEDTVRVVPIAEARRPECLSAFYGIPVTVAQLGDLHVAL